MCVRIINAINTVNNTCVGLIFGQHNNRNYDKKILKELWHNNVIENK